LLKIDESPIIEFLKSFKKEGAKQFLIILPDDIAIRNFSYAALKEGISPKAFESTTLEGLAENILDPDRTRKPRIAEKTMLMQLATEAIQQGSTGPLTRFQQLPLENEDVQEALLSEFDEYLGGTDAASLHSYLINRAAKIEDPFARNTSLQCLEAFKLLEGLLAGKITSLGPFVFLSRSHLVKKAGEALPTGWPAKFSNINEVLIASISVFDANALRFITRIVKTREESPNTKFDVRIFTGIGTHSRLSSRLTKAGIPFREEGKRESPKGPVAAAILSGDKSPTPTFIAAPEKRREVEAVAKKIHELLLNGVHPSEILLVARDSSKYVNLVNEILPAYGIACYVQTRRPYAHLCAYRFAKATLDLITKVSQSSELDWNDITDPLRMGFCLHGGGRSWPLESKEFIYLEESLSVAQQRMISNKTSRDLPSWKIEVDKLRWPRARGLLTKFLEWVKKEADKPPTNPKDARNFISHVLGNYMYQHSGWKREYLSPRLQNPGRFIISNFHPTWFATRIRNELSEFEAYLADCVKTLNLPIRWDTVATAFGMIFGSRTYGLLEQDSSAIRMVDAGNTSFLKAKHLFMMGLQADEFPRICPKGVFLPEELRRTLDSAVDGEAAYLYLRGPTTDYDNEVDFLELSLRTCSEELTCSMAYLDERAHVQAWSTFVGAFRPEDNEKNKISPDDWLPTPSTQGWKELATKNPPWVRHRLFCYHLNRKFPSATPPIDEKGVKELATTIDPAFYSEMLEKRVERYLFPPKQIAVSHKELWFSMCNLQSIIGSPLRLHEIDLHASCPLQFYFFQFLFLWDTNTIDRDTIPFYTKRPHWRLGRIPRRISYVYCSNRTVQPSAKIIDKWANRQMNLGSFSNPNEINKVLSSMLHPFDLTRFSTIIEDEWYLVRQEKKDNIQRDWMWIPDGLKVKMPSGNGQEAEVILPAHRIDLLQGCKLIITHINFSKQLDRLFLGKELVGREYRLSDIQDPLPDYCLPILLHHYAGKDKIAGGIYIEQFEGARRGYYNRSWLSKHKGGSGYDEELSMPPNDSPDSLRQLLTQREWERRFEQYETAIAKRISQMLPKPDITFAAQPSNETCSRCVYDNLCQIPRAEGLA